jgi:hypothetical protein
MSALDESLRAHTAEVAAKVAAQLLEQLDQRIERAVERVLERRQAGALGEPFHKIKGCTPDAARMFLKRHPAIRALGVRVGNRLLFKRDEVLAVLKANARNGGAE